MKEVLRSIDDISLWPVVAFVIFFTFFAVLLVYVMRMKKEEVQLVASIPINEEPVESRTNFDKTLKTQK